MQPLSVAEIKARIDQPFFNAVIKSAGLTITYDRADYVITNTGDNVSEAVISSPGSRITRYTANCPQIPDLNLNNSVLGLLEFSTYNFLIKTTRFCVVVDGVEIFGSPVALHAHGFFERGDEIKVYEGKFYGAAYVRMEPLVAANGRDGTAYHRFYTRQLSDIPKVVEILGTKGVVKEISFLPASFGQLLHGSTFEVSPKA